MKSKILKTLLSFAVLGSVVSGCNSEDHKKTTTIEEKKVETTKEVKNSNSNSQNR